MTEYVLTKVEIVTLALKHTDAGVILSGSADWIEPRIFDCPECGEIGANGVRQVEGAYLCRLCANNVEELLPV